MEKKDQKQPEENMEFVKEKGDSKSNYIFRKSKITKVGFLIVLVILILVVVGVVLSGLYFETSMETL
ncbi:hypothetical protein [Flagellimonas iocasae]|uniref:Uncharacterized protein n=1 Tax=Flagellimonas iocasae TaxID=2055905 RepID=A0ABW4XUF1_9FLAO